jgi:hypothetical protein
VDSTAWYHVPTISGIDYTAEITYYSFWVGLDTGFNDIIQCGNYGEQWNINGYNGWYSISYYTAWIEYLPNNPIAEFGVLANDELTVAAWAGDQLGNLNPNGQYGWFYIYDYSTSPPQEYYGSIPKPSNADVFSGATAEWIMEAPGEYEFPLSDYGSATFNSPELDYLWEGSYNEASLSQVSPITWINMVNGGQLKSEATACGSSASLQWENH